MYRAPPPLGDRGRITKQSSVCISVCVARLEQKRFQLTTKSMVDRSSFSCVGSVFHARGAATEKAVSPIRRRVIRGTTRSPDDEARSADRATDASKSEMYSGNEKVTIKRRETIVAVDPMTETVIRAAVRKVNIFLVAIY